ncbi:MAG: hypothetical protein WKF80_13520 [Thermomicrobiales bacterium]
MSQFLRIVRVDEDAFTDACYDFVTDPHGSRTQRPVVKELDDLMPDVVDVLEAMLLDGTEDRQDIADYVHAIFADPGTAHPYTVGPDEQS